MRSPPFTFRRIEVILFRFVGSSVEFNGTNIVFTFKTPEGSEVIIVAKLDGVFLMDKYSDTVRDILKPVR